MFKKLKKIPMNVFTVLVISAVLSLLFRAVNIVTFNDRDASAISSAQAVEDGKPAATASTDEPPPLTAGDVEKAVAETAESDTNNTPADNASGDDRIFTESEIEVLQSLAKRRDEMNKREQGLAAREALLTAAEQEVDRKLTELNKLRAEIEGLLGKQEKMEESRIISLVKIYEAMKPKEAATIFNTLDMDVLLSVVSRMNERRLSPILAAMDPEKARTVTIKLAELQKLPEAGDAKKPAPAATPPAVQLPAPVPDTP
jgi:flagellar motility protein MotE (MotC chaperone)